MAGPRKMHLVAYLMAGPSASYPSTWRHPAATLHDLFEPERWEHLAKVMEAAFFDACFFADSLGIPDLYKGRYDDYIGRGGQLSLLDPMTLLPLMARVTSRLGLGVTLSTSFTPAYLLARYVSSLDLLSKGRAAWNVVTTGRDFEAQNCGVPGLPPKEQRYDMADEVLEACEALWNGWDADALVLDKASGVFADPGKIRYANYRDRYVSTRGPLPGPRSPQGRPVLMQVAKDKGISFAEAVRRPRALLAGTPEMIADFMEDWFKAGACDGFILPPTIFPATFEEFGRMVVPELQRRGLFRTAYAGATLRENLRDPGSDRVGNLLRNHI